MAKAKTPGSKAKRTTKEQTVTSNPAPISDVMEAQVQAAPVLNKPEPRTAVETKIEAKVNAEPRMFEVRKTDGRKNLVPINIDEEIRRRAYELYQHRGPGGGGEANDWLTAEREVMQRYHQHSA